MLHDFSSAFLARSNNDLQIGQTFRMQHGQNRGGQGDNSHLHLLQQPQQLCAGRKLLLPGQAEGAAIGQRHKGLPYRGIKTEGSELQHPRAGLDVEGQTLHFGEIAQTPVTQDSALGTTGGAGGVDDIGGVIGRHYPVEIAVILLSDERPLFVQKNIAGSVGGQAVQQPFLGEQHRSTGILQHKCNPVRRVGGINRHIGPASFHNAQYPDDHLRRSLGRDGNQSLRAHAQLAQVAGQLIGPAVQFGIGELLILEDHSRNIWLLCRPGFDQFVGTAIQRGGNGGVIPGHQ